MKTVLSLKPEEARDFFLKNESYCNFDIPQYFNFETLLRKISNEIDGKDFKSYYLSSKKPNEFEGVNYHIISNKDGRYAWRPFQLIHPYLYVSLVHLITEKDNWNIITKRITSLIDGNRTIACVSLPAVANRFKKDKAEQISRWSTEIEKESIISSLDFEYLYHADITDCYGSIYTHSIPWAIHTKSVAKKRNPNDIGNKIDAIIQAMSNGQTNGIPQGSVLMDFIAEIVLCYVDSLLYEKINRTKKSDYKIIRYRDDYRIFATNPVIAENIIKELTDILNSLGLKINSSKTFGSNDSLKTSVKADKLENLINPLVFYSLTAELYYISDFAKRFPNSGQLTILLNNFFNKIEKKAKKDINENMKVLISITTDIAYKNPRVYQITSAILSVFLNHLSKSDKNAYLRKIFNKFSKLPNTGIMQIWLQRIILKTNMFYKQDELLCKKVIDQSIKIWESGWLNSKINSFIDSADLINRNEIEKMPVVIAKQEVDLFQYKEHSL